ncbi:2,3-diaminopropionate biosynthesis protein SbnA [Nocardiopsis sp. NPDC101807]|uniref:2,3-diaminopropionate biosynthesis protein SbnA n=1 Tax=Nocardiopsis sp. NPDC101807 TaxID=3364339 RepID=UPI00381C6D97
MPIVSTPHELLESDVYVDLTSVTGREIYLKCEGFNFGGSVKLRTAAAMVAAAEKDGLLRPDTVLVESSSGNLGVALSVVAASKGLVFTCVTDRRCNPHTLRLMRALGADVVVVDVPDPVGGLLGARKERVRQMCRGDDRYLWLNQYENPANWTAHYETTAVEIAGRFPDLDVLFVGAGTGGTLVGCARYFREHAPRVRVVAVDAQGSANFGGEPGPRLIPGLGSSTPAPALELASVDDVVHVPEREAIRTCRALSARGFLFGGSTGTVVGGALDWLDRHDPEHRLRSVAVAPDLGDRYLETVYSDQWVDKNFGDGTLRPSAGGSTTPHGKEGQ